MKQCIIIVLLYSLGVMEFSGASTLHELDHGPITPKLTMVALVDGKAFFIDRTVNRNRTQSLTYCESLGMRLAEITSERQFLALDQAEIEEWTSGSSAWTGGVEIRGIQRYAWERSNVSADSSYIPYTSRLTEDSNYFLYFLKYVNGSYFSNLKANELCAGVLCETIMND